VQEIVDMLSPVEASWLDDHASECIKMLRKIPKKTTYTIKDVEALLSKDFNVGKTIVQLFLDCSKDEMTHRMKELLGGDLGIKLFHNDREKCLHALAELDVPRQMTLAVNRPMHWSNVLVERLKGGRGSAIKGQQRGRGMEDFTEEIIKDIFAANQIDARCRFIGSSGQSTEKADFAVPSKEDPCVLIEVKAYGATGSKQTDILGDLHRIVEQKRDDTYLMLVTDGITWHERLSDLRKLVQLQNEGKIFRIYTQAMEEEFRQDLAQLKTELDL